MRGYIRHALMGASLLVVAGAISVAVAQVGDGYDLSWNTIDGGGGTSTGGSFTLSGTAGQYDAGVLTGGSYSLIGGFWGPLAAGAAPCGYDLNGDSIVDQLDLLLLIQYIDEGNPCGDLNGDGDYDGEDFFAMSLMWGSTVSP